MTTALFAYSPVFDLFGSPTGRQVMRQVDMAPTLSSILGLPIPFSSVGSVILECFPIAIVGSLTETVFQLWRNVEQITNYLVEYSSHNAQLRATNKVDTMLLRFQILKEAKAAISSDMSGFRREYRAFMGDVLAMCRDVWVQFDIHAIGYGLCVLLVSALLCFCIAESVTTDLCKPEYKFVFVGQAVCLLTFAIIFIAFAVGANIDLRTLIAIAAVCIGVLAWWCQRLSIHLSPSVRKHLSIFNGCVAVAVLVSLCGLFSNSFIIEEPSVLLFLMTSVLFLRFLGQRPPRIWKQLSLLSYMVGTLVALRVALEFLRCREEQTRCQDIVLKKYESQICVASIVALGLFVGNWLRSHPPKFYGCVAVLCSMLLAGYWICETFFENLMFAYDIPVVLLPLTVSGVYHLIMTPRPRGARSSLWASFDAPFAGVAVYLALLGCVVLGQTYAVPVILMVVCFRMLAISLSSCRRSANINKSECYDICKVNIYYGDAHMPN